MAKRINLSYLHLHAPLFLGGRNFKEKIFAKDGVSMVHYMDGSRDEIHINHNGHVAYMPRVGNVAVAVPFNPEDADIETPKLKVEKPTNPAPQPKIKAQASAPAGIKI